MSDYSASNSFREISAELDSIAQSVGVESTEYKLRNSNNQENSRMVLLNLPVFDIENLVILPEFDLQYFLNI